MRQHFLKPTVEVPIAEVPIQDKFGDFFTKLRNHRKDATRIRDTLPDLTVALNEYTRNINTIIDIVQKRNAEIILLTQPSMWKDDLPEKLAELL